jgi:hypothetical protein
LATSVTDDRSASRSIPTICSSLNRPFFMSPPWAQGGHLLKDQLVRKTPGRSTEHAGVLGAEGRGIVSRIDGAIGFAEKQFPILKALQIA